MKFTCACGISTYVFDYPAADFEEDGKKMKERHIICNCNREVVVLTSIKDEPDYEDPNADKLNLRRNQVSGEELARRLGLKPPAQPLPAAPAPAPSVILDPNAPVVASGNGVASLFLDKNEADVLREAVTHYGEVFKQGDEQAQAAYGELSSRIAEGMFVMNSAAEARMVRAAFSDRNLRRLWPVNPLDDENSHNVLRATAAKDLTTRIDDKLDGVI